MVLESTIENYLVGRVKALGGIALKGAVPGQRFVDRICILPDGVTLWVECKRPSGGRRSALQEHVIGGLLNLGHSAFFVKSREEVDLVLGGARVFGDGGLYISYVGTYMPIFQSTSKGLVDWKP